MGTVYVGFRIQHLLVVRAAEDPPWMLCRHGGGQADKIKLSKPKAGIFRALI